MQNYYKILAFVSLCAAVLLLVVFWNDNYNTKVTKYEPIFYKSYFNVGGDRLINLSFEYIFKSNLCGNTSKQIFAIFIVTSYIGNIETRNYLRRAFSNVDLEHFNLRRVFLLGCETNMNISQDIVENESKQFGDIIQGNFMEAYRNLTYKHVMGLKWVSQHCTNVKYVIKMDDDTVVDVRRLVKHLRKLHLPSEKYIIGYVLQLNKVIRDQTNKWYVSEEEFEKDTYPTYVSGWLYVTTPQLAIQLSAIANKVKYFWIDDVFVTGILAEKLNVSYLYLNEYFTIDAEPIRCCLRESIFLCNYWIGPSENEVDMFYNFNALAYKCLSSNVCTKRSRYTNKKCFIDKTRSFNYASSVRPIKSAKAIIIPYRVGNPSLKFNLPNVF